MQSNPIPNAIGAALRVLGAGLVGGGFVTPLLVIPVIGTVRYVTTSMGGQTMAGIIAGLLLVGAIFTLLQQQGLRTAGWFLGGIGFGTLAGTLYGFYRWAQDMIMQLGQGEELLKQAQYASGAYLMVAGAVLWVVSAFVGRAGRK